MTDFRALCSELVAAVDTLLGYGKSPAYPGQRLILTTHVDGLEEAADRAGAALAEPVPPADGEVAGLVAWLREQAEYNSINIGSTRVPRFTRAADLLERLAPQPVPEGPSDEELVQLAFREKLGRLDSSGNIITRYYYPMDIGENVIDFARAVLARWGNLAAKG